VFRSLVSVVVAAVVAVIPASTPATPPFALDTPVITEDDPRWDCRTMGDRVCGDVDTLSEALSRIAYVIAHPSLLA
jgi:hypothetical protein